MGARAQSVVKLLPRLAGLALAAVVLLGSRRVEAHPLHSTITELTVDAARGTVRATVRVFADDLGTATLRTTRGRRLATNGPAWDAAILAYATSTFALRDVDGRSLPLRTCGVRRTADLVWLCLEAELGRHARAVLVRNVMLCDLYEDQVNVVQGTVEGARRSLLFVRGDGFKSLR